MTNEKLSFQFVMEYQEREEIMNLDGSKATPIGDISVYILKYNLYNFHEPFKSIWHFKIWFIDCQVRCIWVWNRSAVIHEKLWQT